MPCLNAAQQSAAIRSREANEAKARFGLEPYLTSHWQHNGISLRAVASCMASQLATVQFRLMGIVQQVTVVREYD